MATDPSIILAGKAPEIASPIQTIGGLMQLRGQTAEIALRQQQAEESRARMAAEQAKAKQVEEDRRLDLADQNAFQEAIKDPTLAPKIMAGDLSPLYGKVRPTFLEKAQTGIDTHLKNTAATSETDLKNQKAKVSTIREALDGLIHMADSEDPDWQNAYPQVLANLKAQKAFEGLPASEIPENVTDVKQLTRMLASVGAYEAHLTAAQEYKKKNTDIAKDQQTTEDAAAKAERDAATFATEAPVKTAIAEATLADKGLLTPEQRSQADTRVPPTIPAEQQFVTEYQKLHPGTTVAQAQRAYAVNQHVQSAGDTIAALDRESKRFASPHEASLKSADAQLEKIADARAMINGPAEAQALGIPKVLTALVSGQGSGVRITQAELNSIAQARGVVGNIEGFINSISGEGKLSATQKTELTQILDDVQVRLKYKQALANEALDKINAARSRDEIVRIDSDYRKKLADTEKVTAAPAASKYKAGETRVINGVTYQRDDAGNWHPK